MWKHGRFVEKFAKIYIVIENFLGDGRTSTQRISEEYWFV